MTSEIEITQADRDAAASVLGYRDWDDATDYRLSGQQDRDVSDHVKAFARHRIDACASVQKERDELREMLGEAVDAIKELLPSNVGWLPAHMPDSATLPLDVTFGEIRKGRAFLARYEGGVK